MTRRKRPHAPPHDDLTPAERLRLADAMCKDAAALREAGKRALPKAPKT